MRSRNHWINGPVLAACAALLLPACNTMQRTEAVASAAPASPAKPAKKSMEESEGDGECAAVPVAAPPSEVTYENTIRALVERECADCHQDPESPTMEVFEKNKKKFKERALGPRFFTYEELLNVVSGDDAGALMRRLDDGEHSKTGKRGNMFKNLGCDTRQRAANLALFKRWVGNWSLKRNNELTLEERSRIRAPR